MDPQLTRSPSSWRGANKPAGTAFLLVVGGGYLVTATWLSFQSSTPSGTQWVALLLLMALYGVAFRTEFYFPAVISVPTEPVLVAMLFLVPVELVPIAVLISQLLSVPPAGDTPWRVARSVLVNLCPGWHCIGPVLVLLAFEAHTPDLAHWPIYLLALLAQFVFDGGVALASDYIADRFSTDAIVDLLWAFAVDGALAVLGLIAILAGGQSLGAIALAAAPVALIAMLNPPRRKLAENVDVLSRDVESARDEARADALTGLGNRRAWDEALLSAQAAFDRKPELEFGILVADVNDLKYVNDTFGHDKGDLIIAQLASVLTSVVPTSSTVCRIGGDEFAVLIRNAEGPVDLTALVQQVQLAAAAIPPTAGVQLSAGLGVAAFPGHVDLEATYQAADHALIEEKKVNRAFRRELRSAN